MCILSGTSYAPNNNKKKENKSNIYLIFPVKNIFLGKQRLNEEEFFFIQKLQLINAKGTKELETHHFAIPNEIIGLEKVHQCLLKPLGQIVSIMWVSVIQSVEDLHRTKSWPSPASKRNSVVSALPCAIADCL